MRQAWRGAQRPWPERVRAGREPAVFSMRPSSCGVARPEGQNVLGRDRPSLEPVTRGRLPTSLLCWTPRALVDTRSFGNLRERGRSAQAAGYWMTGRCFEGWERIRVHGTSRQGWCHPADRAPSAVLAFFIRLSGLAFLP